MGSKWGICSVCDREVKLVEVYGGKLIVDDHDEAANTVRKRLCRGCGWPPKVLDETPDKINVANNTDKPSPNWGWMSRYTIMQAGKPYLRRLRVIQTPLFGIYLHAILEDDAAIAPHDHPWSFITLMVKGEYVEERFFDKDKGYGVPMERTSQSRTLLVGQWAFRRKTALHKVKVPKGRCRTLIFTGPRTRGCWGFSPEPGTWIHNTQYVERNEAGQVTRDGR